MNSCWIICDLSLLYTALFDLWSPTPSPYVWSSATWPLPDLMFIILALLSRPAETRIFSEGWKLSEVTTLWCWLVKLAFLSFACSRVRSCKTPLWRLKTAVFVWSNLPMGSKSSESLSSLSCSSFLSVFLTTFSTILSSESESLS